MIRCPYCGKSHYVVNYTTSTLLGWLPTFVDGVQVNDNPNHISQHCTCCECDGDFSVDANTSEVFKVMSPKEKENIKLDKAKEVSKLIDKIVKEEKKEVDYSNLKFDIRPYFNEYEINKIAEKSLTIKCETIKLVSDTIDVTINSKFLEGIKQININGNVYVLKEKIIQEV